MKHATRLNSLLPALHRQSREPFQELLAEILSCKPTNTAIKRAATRNPGAWVKAISVLAPLAGYERQPDPTTVNNIYMQINNMSDVEVLRRIEAIDAEAIETDTPGGGGASDTP